MAQILLVEDDAAVSASISTILVGLGHQVEAMPSAELAWEHAQANSPELVLLDLHLPGRGGLDLLPDLLSLDPRPPVVVITALPTAQNAMEAMAKGAAAHLEKPVDLERLEEVIADLLKESGAAAGSAGPTPPPQLVGSSSAMLTLGRRLGALARSDCTVLIRGESGTGKELAARAIHSHSGRQGGPFVGLSCAALPDTLLEAELFGHEKGAFTGAHQSRSGRVEMAEGGTLFLDEIAELSLPAQAKLLRFLEERSFERVGGSATRKADVRLLTATNAALEELVEAGTFREDLYFRLNVARLDLPPLRERLEDLPLLIDHFLAQMNASQVRVHPSVLSHCLQRSWPGNVRELRNLIESAMVSLGEGSELRPEHLPGPSSLQHSGDELKSVSAAVRRLVKSVDAKGSQADLYDRVQAETQRALIETALEITDGNQVAATRLLGMNRATFRRKMKDYGFLAPDAGEGQQA